MDKKELIRRLKKLIEYENEYKEPHGFTKMKIRELYQDVDSHFTGSGKE